MDYDGHNPPADRDDDEVHAGVDLDELGKRAFDADQRRQDALSREQRDRSDWADAEADRCLFLFMGREQLGNDNEYHAWLVQHGLGDLNKDDRRCLVCLGRHIEITREVLKTTHLRSPQSIWNKEVAKQVLKLKHPDNETPESDKLKEDNEYVKDALKALRDAVQKYRDCGKAGKDRVRRKAVKGFGIKLGWLKRVEKEIEEAKDDDDAIEVEQDPEWDDEEGDE